MSAGYGRLGAWMEKNVYSKYHNNPFTIFLLLKPQKPYDGTKKTPELPNSAGFILLR